MAAPIGRITALLWILNVIAICLMFISKVIENAYLTAFARYVRETDGETYRRILATKSLGPQVAKYRLLLRMTTLDKEGEQLRRRAQQWNDATRRITWTALVLLLMTMYSEAI